jgi:hypothetical protein
MQAVKKAVKSVIEREQRRVLVVTLSHDNELVLKGDNVSLGYVENNDSAKEALKAVLKTAEEEDDTSYNFGRHLVYDESKNLDFPKMFAKLGGRKWKGGEIAKTLSKYFALLDFGRNAPKTYGKAEDKPVWWPKNPKWKNFRNPSKSSKEECTLLITLLLEHYGIDAKMHYVHYPEEEGEDSESSGDDDDREDEDGLNGGEDEEMEEEEEGEMYENPSNCNAGHESDDENFGQDERRRRRKNYVMI